MWHRHLVPWRDFSYTGLCILVTWPYHRTLRYFTLDPAARLAQSIDDDDGSLAASVEQWQTSKTTELDFVCKASTVAAAAVIGIFSWNELLSTFWVARALFYLSLSLSIWAVLASAQQYSVIHALPKSTSPAQLRRTASVILRHRVGRVRGGSRGFAELNMLFVWQVPVMLMSYGMVMLLLALTLHVCSPLIAPYEDGDRKVAIFYLGTGLVLFLNFAWSSAWVYWTPDAASLDDEEGAKGEEGKCGKEKGEERKTFSTASTMATLRSDDAGKEQREDGGCEKLDV